MGCVYFIKHMGMDPIKIGMSTSDNPYDRLSSMQIASPFGMELLGFIKTDDPIALEKQYHTEFKSSHIRGEWYSISEDKVNSILHYHNSNKVIFQIADLIEELQISPRETLKYIRKIRMDREKEKEALKQPKRLAPEEEFKQVYLMIKEVTDLSWIPKKEILNTYRDEYRCSIGTTYTRFKKVEKEKIFLSQKEGREVFLKLKGDELKCPE
tara:strand:- start:120 stop:752 length:633 start_codon:yes stop_codon:yes gene_type:complete